MSRNYFVWLIFLLLVVATACGRNQTADPTPTPIVVTVLVEPTALPLPDGVATIDLRLAEERNAIRIVVTNDAINAELKVITIGEDGEIIISDSSVDVKGVIISEQNLDYRPPELPPQPIPTVTLIVDSAAAPTPTPLRPTRVDNTMCDVVYSADYIKSSLCRSFKSFDIDIRCLSELELAIELNRAGWPSDALETAVLEFMQESNGCINAINQNAVGLAGIAWIGHTVTGWNARRPSYPQFADRNPYDPQINLSLALEIYLDNGWSPWRGSTTTITPVPPATATIIIRPTATATPTSTPTPAIPATAELTAIPATDTPSPTPAPCFLRDATQPGNETGVLNEACEVMRATGCTRVEENYGGGWICLEWMGKAVHQWPLTIDDFAVLPGADGMSADDVALFHAACTCATTCRLSWISGTAFERGPWGVNVNWLRNDGVDPLSFNMFEPNNAISLARRMVAADGGFYRWPASCVNEINPK